MESASRLPLEDKARITDTLFGAAPVTAIPEGAARKIVGGYYDAAVLGATVDAYLETVTVPGTARTALPIQDRAVWIIRLSGFSREQPGPIAPEGPAGSHFLHFAYVFIDATTGEPLFADWRE